MKKAQQPYMAKNTIYPETQGRKNKVLNRHINLTGINKVPNVRWVKVRLAKSVFQE